MSISWYTAEILYTYIVHALVLNRYNMNFFCLVLPTCKMTYNIHTSIFVSESRYYLLIKFYCKWHFLLLSATIRYNQVENVKKFYWTNKWPRIRIWRWKPFKCSSVLKAYYRFFYFYLFLFIYPSSECHYQSPFDAHTSHALSHVCEVVHIHILMSVSDWHQTSLTCW